MKRLKLVDSFWNGLKKKNGKNVKNVKFSLAKSNWRCINQFLDSMMKKISFYIQSLKNMLQHKHRAPFMNRFVFKKVFSLLNE